MSGHPRDVSGGRHGGVAHSCSWLGSQPRTQNIRTWHYIRRLIHGADLGAFVGRSAHILASREQKTPQGEQSREESVAEVGSAASSRGAQSASASGQGEGVLIPRALGDSRNSTMRESNDGGNRAFRHRGSCPRLVWANRAGVEEDREVTAIFACLSRCEQVPAYITLPSRLVVVVAATSS